MKKLLILVLVVGAALFFWNKSQHASGPLDDLRHRLDAAEQSFQQAGRAAGATGVDTTASADSAMQEVEQVQRELHALETSASGAQKQEIESLLARADDLRHRMG